MKAGIAVEAAAPTAEAVPDGGTDAVSDNSAEEPEDTKSEPEESNDGGQDGTPE